MYPASVAPTLMTAYNVTISVNWTRSFIRYIEDQVLASLMYSNVLSYNVAFCETCRRTKTSTWRKREPLKPFEVVDPFGRIQTDFVTDARGISLLITLRAT